MGTPATPESPTPRRDWIDVTVRLATSWVGLFTAYVTGLLLAIKNFDDLKKGLQGMGIPPWGGIALVAV